MLFRSTPQPGFSEGQKPGKFPSASQLSTWTPTPDTVWNAVGSNTLIIELIHGDVKPANQVKPLSDLLHRRSSQMSESVAAAERDIFHLKSCQQHRLGSS